MLSPPAVAAILAPMTNADASAPRPPMERQREAQPELTHMQPPDLGPLAQLADIPPKSLRGPEAIAALRTALPSLSVKGAY